MGAGGVHWLLTRDAPPTMLCRGGYFLNLLPAVCEEARTQIGTSSNSGETIDPVPVEYRRHHRFEAVLTWVSSPISWNFLESENAGKLVIQRTALKRASVHGCFGGGNSCDIYLLWIFWTSRCRSRRSSFASLVRGQKHSVAVMSRFFSLHRKYRNWAGGPS